MKQKKHIIFITVVLIFFSFISCKIEFSEPNTSSVFCLCTGDTISLEYKTGLNSRDNTYEWYECQDQNKTNPVACGCDENNITITDFAPNTIRFFYCTHTTPNGNTYQSKTYIVFRNDRPIMEIQTEKEIESGITWQDATITMKSKKGNVKEILPAQIKGRGHISWQTHSKKNYNIKLNEKTSLLDMPKSKKWALIGHWNDTTYLGNRYASVLGKEIFNTSEDWQPSYEYINVFKNGQFQGFYVLGENISIEKNRINVPDISKITSEYEDINGDCVTDLYDAGFIAEITCVAQYNSFETLHGTEIVMKDPDLDETENAISSRRILEHIRGIINKMESSFYDNSSEDYLNYIDLDSFVDWYIVNEFTANRESSFTTSCYCTYYPSDGKIHMGPNWDFDKSVCMEKEKVQQFYTLTERNNWISTLMQKESFKAALKNRWNEKKSLMQATFENAYNEYLSNTSSIKADDLLWPGKKDNGKYNTDTIASSIIPWFNARYSWFDSYINSL